MHQRFNNKLSPIKINLLNFYFKFSEQSFQNLSELLCLFNVNLNVYSFYSSEFNASFNVYRFAYSLVI